MPYAMYLRKSRADAEAEARGEGETLSRHRAMLDALAARHGRVISDEDVFQEIVSGDSIASRPQMQRLLDSVLAGRYEGVYVTEVERLARGDTSDQGRVAQTFMLSGTKIITLSKIYDPSNEFDVEFFEFSLFMSRREYKSINRRIQAGRMQSIREGRYIASCPSYGYRRIRIAGEKGFTLAVEPTEAAIVRQIFSWYLQGLGITRIAGLLHDMGVSPGKYSNGWSPARIYRILTNEVYIGKIRWGRVKAERTLSAGIVQSRLITQSNYDLFPGRHPAIVDVDTFDAVQLSRKQRDIIPVRKGKALQNPFAGLIICGECGHIMLRLPAAGRQPALFKCRTRGCPTVQTYAAPVEAAILATLGRWVAGSAIELPEDAQRSSASADRQTLDALLSERSSLAAQISRLQTLVEQGAYTIEMFKQRFALHAERRAALDASIAEIESRISQCPIYFSSDELHSRLVRLFDAFPTATPAEKNALFKSVISRIIYRKSVRGVRGVPADQFHLEIYPAIKIP